MPFFKVLSFDSAIKVTISAKGLEELITSFRKHIPVPSASYDVYDATDGSLIGDDECLVGLADFATTVKGTHLGVKIVPSGQPLPEPVTPPRPVTPTRPVTPPNPPVTPPNVPPPVGARFSTNSFPPLRRAILDLKTAAASPPRVRNRVLSRARSKLVKDIVSKAEKAVLKPGELMNYCQKIYAECPEAFVVTLREDMTDCVFPQFTRSVYNGMNYAKSVQPGFEKKSRKRTFMQMEENADDVEQVEPQVPLLCLDSNGCMEGKWDPIIDDVEALLAKKQELLRFAMMPDPTERDVSNLVMETYPLQREDINRARSNAHWNSVFATWHILKWVPLFFIHADNLLGKDLRRQWYKEAEGHVKIVEFMEEYLLKLLSSKTPKSSKQHDEMNGLILHKTEANTALNSTCATSIAVFSLLVVYFKENTNNLHLILDSTATDEDAIARGNGTSECPLIIVKGSSIFDLSASTSVLVRGKFLIKTSSYLEAVLVLLVSYFVFNISYPKSLNKSLEFMQRFFLKINPEVQCRKEKSKLIRMNSDVRKLALTLADFEVATGRWAIAATD